ncbi:MAG: hypothetical protein QOG61_150, partial [Candidatus Binataceae bacterium]|nr:hypothetical protein [Candidatus Binataceae bacterium]
DDDISEVNHVAPTTTAANGSLSDAHESSTDGYDSSPEHHENETPPASEHHSPKGGNS